jgi:hypothetical protein
MSIYAHPRLRTPTRVLRVPGCCAMGYCVGAPAALGAFGRLSEICFEENEFDAVLG